MRTNVTTWMAAAALAALLANPVLAQGGAGGSAAGSTMGTGSAPSRGSGTTTTAPSTGPGTGLGAGTPQTNPATGFGGTGTGTGAGGIGQPGGPDLSRAHGNDPHPQTTVPSGPTEQNVREPYQQPRGGAPR